MNLYYNRKIKCVEEEQVAAGKYIEWMYSSPIGMGLLEKIFKKKLISVLYGRYCDSRWSQRQVKSFVKNFNINMEEYHGNIGDYKNFNEFFARNVKTEARPIEMDPNALISCGDGKFLAYENIDKDQMFQVKGITYSLKELLRDQALAGFYHGGSCLVLRLAPTDYHRFHFIDDGVCEKTIKIKGEYYSVNPMALKKIPKIFCENKREITILDSDNLGKVAYIEVGATFVGSIIQTFEKGKRIFKGQEKGYFKFGGSTVILLFEKNKIQIDEDLIKNTQEDLETKLFMGEKIGTALEEKK